MLFILGLIIGEIFGVMLMALIQINKDKGEDNGK